MCSLGERDIKDYYVYFTSISIKYWGGYLSGMTCGTSIYFQCLNVT